MKNNAVTPEIKQKLIKSAMAVREFAYAPYSSYKVGAALLADNGKIYAGANFENASYGAGTCAERVALGAALSDGARKFIAIAVAGDSADITPCGICRQALSEFGDILIICTDGKDTKEYTLSELLPSGFKL